MRTTAVAMLLALVTGQAAPAVAQGVADLPSLPAANPNTPPVSAQSRYRYQSGHWWYRNPSPYSTFGHGNEWAEREPQGYGEW